MLSSNPLVSIVIPCYNQGHYLRQAIDSALSQDYPGIELIVLDDGSTDGTQALLASYPDRFYRESHANMGQAGTLNKGWRMSKGEILSYLSADDFLLPGAVRRSVEALVEGEKKSIDEWIEEIREGPRYAEVTKIDQESKDFSGRLPDFDVKF